VCSVDVAVCGVAGAVFGAAEMLFSFVLCGLGEDGRCNVQCCRVAIVGCAAWVLGVWEVIRDFLGGVVWCSGNAVGLWGVGLCAGVEKVL
jgi:hypothetical protein